MASEQTNNFFHCSDNSMTLNSLNQLLTNLIAQPHLAAYQRYQTVCQAWDKVVNERVAAQTRPRYINRNILWVATASAVWAQQLSLTRYSLLKQLNTHLSAEPLEDIRFSSAQWYQPQALTPNAISRVSASLSPEVTTTPQAAFEQWVKVLQDRDQTLLLCPQCHCPTPLAELNRWNKCSLCMVQHWQ
ncbi:DciA family protein [Crocosphaera sp. UHCC 0190]|uniref:DUF721 domain-containing protein n=1 Tax=Crocosphaera sp. UHCC 0190 TaxID=3110246 RepID=UPI002B1FE45F|nr:DciA family protein [Crocosphaera sp. UHCC 0190]MEA5512074.1 DciA family protein [Crocosphaera sp. UHCC 0190]